jgi:hypothetical protein
MEIRASGKKNAGGSEWRVFGKVDRKEIWLIGLLILVVGALLLGSTELANLLQNLPKVGV